MRKTARQTFCVTLDLLDTITNELTWHSFESVIAHDEADDYMSFKFYQNEKESLVLVQDTDLLARGTNWVNVRSHYGGIFFPEKWDMYPREAMIWSNELPLYVNPKITDSLQLKQNDKKVIEDFRKFVTLHGYKGIIDLIVFSRSDYTYFVGFGIKTVLNILKDLDIKSDLSTKIDKLRANVQDVGGKGYIEKVISHFNDRKLNLIHEKSNLYYLYHLYLFPFPFSFPFLIRLLVLLPLSLNHHDSHQDLLYPLKQARFLDKGIYYLKPLVNEI